MADDLTRMAHDKSESIHPETYQYTNSGKYVRRLIAARDGRKLRSTIYVGPGSEDAPAFAYDKAFLRGRTSRGPTPDGVVRVADVFSGCGGLSLGALEACLAIGREFVPVLAMDNSAAALGVYKRNFHPLNAIGEDIEEIVSGAIGDRATDAEKRLVADVGAVDVLLAGPPCQGASSLNNHTRGTDARNRLYERAIRLAELLLPELIIIENVPPIVRAHQDVVGRSLEVLEQLQYAVEPAIVDLWKLGVPQLRKRHILIAVRHRQVRIAEVVTKYQRVDPGTVEWAMGDIEDEERQSEFSIPTDHSPENKQRIDYLFEHNAYDLPNHMRPPCHQGSHSYKSMYGRLRYDQPAQTVTTGYGSPGQGRYVHPARRRTLTPHEAARLQLFPDSFEFPDDLTRGELASMIGNAAPMKLSYVFVTEHFR